jgi:hypothetical protein
MLHIVYAHKLTCIPIKSLALKAIYSTRNKFLVNLVELDRHDLWPRDVVIASDLAFGREHSAAKGNPELSIS